LSSFLFLFDLFLVFVLLLILDLTDHFLDLWLDFCVLANEGSDLIVKPALKVDSQISVRLWTQVTNVFEFRKDLIPESEKILFGGLACNNFFTELFLVFDKDLLLKDSALTFFVFSFAFGFESLRDHELSVTFFLISLEFLFFLLLLLVLLKLINGRYDRPSNEYF
jgi:hypothetical protein